jgi:multiple sugar transport system permease protein
MATPGTQLQLGYPLGSSLTIPQLIYQYGAIDSNTAPACIVSIILFLMTMLFTLVLLRRKSGFMGRD